MTKLDIDLRTELEKTTPVTGSVASAPTETTTMDYAQRAQAAREVQDNEWPW